MRSIRHKTLFVAAFAFAGGFAATSVSASDPCGPCREVYDDCMAGPNPPYEFCARQYNTCIPRGCALMPLPWYP